MSRLPIVEDRGFDGERTFKEESAANKEKARNEYNKIKYEVLMSDDKVSFNYAVRKYLSFGYSLCGGVTMNGTKYVQAVMLHNTSTQTQDAGKRRKSNKYNLKRKNKTKKKRQFWKG